LLKTGGLRGYDCFEAVDLEVCLWWEILWSGVVWTGLGLCDIECVSLYSPCGNIVVEIYNPNLYPDSGSRDQIGTYLPKWTWFSHVPQTGSGPIFCV
jgi:hypothetical protein